MPTFRTPEGGSLEIVVEQLVIAGWAARDLEAVEVHIRELEEIGVPRPSSVPLFYRVAADCLTTAARLQVLGGESSGEVEAVLLADAQGGLWVGVGSDHTDRKVEAYSVAVSKQLCPKPVSAEVWPFAEVADHWDSLVLRSHVVIDGVQPLPGGAGRRPARPARPDAALRRRGAAGARQRAFLRHARRPRRGAPGAALRDGAGGSGAGPQPAPRL